MQKAQIQFHILPAQSLIRAFALHLYILLYPIILLADSESSKGGQFTEADTLQRETN